MQADYDLSRFTETSPRKPLAKSECNAMVRVGVGTVNNGHAPANDFTAAPDGTI